MNETGEIKHPHVTLTLNASEAEVLYVQMLRARDGLRNAIRANNGGDIGYFFGWLDACMTKLADNCPQSVKRIAIEDARDMVRGGIGPAVVGGHGGISGPLSGGGNKPN